MFERFTEKAIKVITFAQEEASQARHSKLYPEHVMLGVIREGSSITARFLRAAGLKAEILREQIQEILVIKSSTESNEFLQFGPATKRVLTQALSEAKSLGANYISPDHLFLSLINDKSLSITTLLDGLDVDVDRIKSSVIRVCEKREKITSHPESSNKPYSKKSEYFNMPSIFEESESVNLMNAAREKLRNSSYENLGTEHILLSLLENRDSYLYTLLENEGVSYQDFVERIGRLDSRQDEYNTHQCQFTPSAFSALSSAYEIAKELGYTSIKPEHILLGMLKEKKGIAYKIIKESGIDTESLFEKIIKPIEKQKPVTLTIIKLAKEEARRLGHSIVGTEQILLGILGEGTSQATKVLRDLGVTLKDARMEVEKMMGYGNGYSDKEMALTPRAKKLLEIAWNKAKEFNHTRIESEHLLLGIIEEKKCMAMKVLQKLGVDELEIKQGVLRAIEEKKLNSSANIE